MKFVDLSSQKCQIMDMLPVQTVENRDKASRRFWSGDEDKCLADCLLDMHREGRWKTEGGGFKPGYLVYMEKQMSRLLPDSGLKASNIDSRLTYLKRQFFAVWEIKQTCGGCGFGWDDAIKVVTGNREAFNEYCKSHRDARGLYRKSFPFFGIFEEIFAKDKATGAKASNAADRDDDEDMTRMSANETEDIPAVNHSGGGGHGEETSSQTPGQARASSTSKRKGCKRKKENNDALQSLAGKFVDMMQQLMQNQTECVAQLVKSFGSEEKNPKAGLVEELRSIDRLNPTDRLKAMRKMSIEDVAMFRELNTNEEKLDFVRLILDS
ncbi:hypothetical protein Dimus_039821 [Dionaea muscipula]